jgi:hypothetical protein
MDELVTVIGCGPSGLAAALAAADSGYKVLIASNTDAPSRQYGCQYLHAPIPGYEDVPHTTVDYHLCGTADQYRRKVYGDKWRGKVSPEDFVGEHDAWDIRVTYMRMWKDLHANTHIQFIKIPRIERGILPAETYITRPKAIISTIPAPALCYVPAHEFKSHEIYANGSTKQGTEAVNTIVCDGTKYHEWYRNACVFGYRTTEWARKPTDGEAVVAVTKPLLTNCSCCPGVHRIGRYGKWKKSYLVHQAYPEVMEILNG